MITVDKYNLTYNTEHLLSPKPKTYKEVLKRLEKLQCKLFYNIISSPECYYEKNFSDGRIKQHYLHMSAEQRFQNIFHERKLYANPKSFFVNKLNVKASDCEEIKSVSFTFSDYKDLPRHFERRGSEFGICFFHDFLQNKGLRPVEYLSELNPEAQKRLVFNSPHLLEIYTPKYDMRWEHEWRIGYDLDFTEDDIAFVIVPHDRFDFFLDWFDNHDNFSNIQILSSDAFKSYVDYLIRMPQQSDNNWNQIEVFASPQGRGFKLSPEDFNYLSTPEQAKFLNKHLSELECFIKNTILSKYERAYTHKFLRFRSKIKNVEGIAALFDQYLRVIENINEPEDAERDLVKGLYGSLYETFSSLD